MTGSWSAHGPDPWPRCILLGHEGPSSEAWAAGLMARLDPAEAYIRHAFTGREVVRVVETGVVDVALVSDAPRIDGLSVLRMIRRIDSALPCVLITGHPDRRWLERAMALRADSVFSPPVDVEMMCRLLWRLLVERAGAGPPNDV